MSQLPTTRLLQILASLGSPAQVPVAAHIALGPLCLL